MAILIEKKFKCICGSEFEYPWNHETFVAVHHHFESCSVINKKIETNTAPTGTEAKVCADIAARQRKGIEKYGTTVEKNPLTLREWLSHSYQECLDMAIYLRRSMDEMDNEQTNRQR
jgi:hypothetical protein